jgi:P-type Cu+ transporter
MSKHEQDITLKVEGMTCVNCALSIERSVKKLGVNDVAVNFSTKELHVIGLNNESIDSIKQAVVKAGFEIYDESNIKKNQWIKKVLLVVSLAIATYFMIQMLLPHNWFNVYIDLVLGTIVLSIGWYKFGKGAINSAISGSANMYVLILMGSSMAYLLSIYLMLTQAHAHLYFEAAAVIIALVMLGDKIEEIAINKTTSSLRNLAQFTIKKGKKITSNGVKIVGINEIRKGDFIQVNTGDAIPTDGEITEGGGNVNEAILTGESNPVFKTSGNKIMGGSTLSDGNFVYKVTKEGHESALAQISAMVQKASSEKAEIQRYADKISAVFVPLIITFSIIWLAVNLLIFNNSFEMSFIRSVTILVVSCPCAMGLATPIAVMVGLGKLSENGILVKKAQAIENLANIKNLLLDKTGTITTGNFKIESLQTFNFEQNEAESILFSMESKSSHPIAVSLTNELKNAQPIDLINFEEIKGSGLKAEDTFGNKYLLGNAAFTKQNQEEPFDNFLTKNGTLIAVFNIKDEVKDGVSDTIEYFKSKDINSVVLSGDNEKNALR